MSLKSPQSSPLWVSDRAKLRWTQRAGGFEVSVRTAWRDGFHVGLPSHRGTARLHPPSETLLLERDDELVTVLDATHTSYRDDHLVECGQCGLAFQPSRDDRSCPWCPRADDQTAQPRSP